MAEHHNLFFEDRGAGDPVVLIAGLGATHRIWWNQFDMFSRHFRIIAPDNRDSGKSFHSSRPYSISHMASDLAQLVETLNPGPVNIIGISMGGFIALQFAIKYPDLVRKIVLVSTSCGGSPHVPAGPELDDVIIRREGESAEARMGRIVPFITGPGFSLKHPGQAQQYIRIFVDEPVPDELYDRQMAATADFVRTGVADKLKTIRAPAMIIHGIEDRVIPFRNGQYLASHLKRCRFFAPPGVGHLPPIEVPRAFNAHVLDFLR